MAKRILRVARRGGINCFDNAETYGTPQGAAEAIMGEAMRQLKEEEPQMWRRSDLVITTKLFWGGPGLNEKGLSRKHVREGMDASLKRLQVEYVDLVFCHRPVTGLEPRLGSCGTLGCRLQARPADSDGDGGARDERAGA